MLISSEGCCSNCSSYRQGELIQCRQARQQGQPLLEHHGALHGGDRHIVARLAILPVLRRALDVLQAFSSPSSAIGIGGRVEDVGQVAFDIVREGVIPVRQGKVGGRLIVSSGSINASRGIR